MSMPDLMNFQGSTPRPPFPMGFRGGVPNTPTRPFPGMPGMGTPMGFPPRTPMPGTPSPYPGFGLPPVQRTNPTPQASPFMMNKRPMPFLPNQPPAKRQKKGSDESDDEGSGEEDIDEEALDNNDQKERKGFLIQQMTPAQLNRHEAYKRSGYYKTQKNLIKKTMGTVSGMKVNPNAVVVMAGIAKVYVGELTEMARMVMDQRGDQGPIKPHHLRAAYAKLKQEGKISNCAKYQKRLFSR